MKGVSAQGGVRTALLHRSSDPGCAVGAHVRDSCGSLLAEKVKDAVPGNGIRPVDGVDQPATIMVDDHEQVAMATSIGDFVDADSRDALEEVITVHVGYDPGDDLPNGAPRAAQQLTGGLR